MKSAYYRYWKNCCLNIRLSSCIILLLAMCTQEKLYGQGQEITIIPKPLFLQQSKGVFKIGKQTILIAPDKKTFNEFDFFQQYLGKIVGYKLQQSSDIKEYNSIRLIVDSTKIKLNEAYQFNCDVNGISITAATTKGLFYGVQTLIQLVQKAKDGALVVPHCIIKDQPRFDYRGMHLDVSRHMFSVQTIKKWLDVLALYKINTFHWHLTDDQGWRIEIKKYPKLQSISAWRDETLIGHKRHSPHRFDGKRYGGYYSQEEVRDIVAYAQSRHIDVIPEIEMPGHALAALAAYPELGCTGGPYQTATYWGVFDDVYCAGNEATFTFLQQVLDEVIPLFPAPYVHIGGDECPKTRWKSCPKCQARIRDLKLKDEHELQSYFIGRIDKYLNTKGKKTIGWDEILEGGLSSGATVMSWRGLDGGIAAAKMHHNVIMTPEKYVYLDYYQSLNSDEQIAAGGYTSLQKVYDYEPLPDGLTASESKYILGIQANVWSEYLNNEDKAEYMIFPRILALAETAWSQKAAKNYADFLSRLNRSQKNLQPFKINYAQRFYDIQDSIGTKKSGIKLFTDLPGAKIRYTLNGKEPGVKSTLYTHTIYPKKTVELKAAAFLNNKIYGKVYEKNFYYNVATDKKVSLKNQSEGNFKGDKQTLVNGIRGTAYYNDGQWLGFSGTDFVAIVDLGSDKTISQIGVNVLKYHWQKMWAPKSLSFLISTDGIHYRAVFQQKNFPEEGVNRIFKKIKPQSARYVKIIGVNQGIIPDGEYGAGGKAWLLADEITIHE